MSQTKQIDCPICGRSFPDYSVNEHVNKCLNANESSSTTAGEKGRLKGRESVNKSPLASGSLSDRSAGVFGKTLGTTGTTFLSTSPPSGALKRSLSNNSSNLAGKSSNNPPFKRLKSLNSSPNSSQGDLKKTGDLNGPFTSETNETVSFQSSNFSFRDKKGTPKSKNGQFKPLAERMRPKTLDEYVGQSKVLGSNSLLRTLLEAEEIPSMILWGPPGCGKVNMSIGHFRVPKTLTFKMRLSAKPFLWK